MSTTAFLDVTEGDYGPLGDLIAAFRQHLYLPDPAPLEVMLGTVVGNLLPGDPIWLLLVGPPSSGKTELLGALSKLDYCHTISTVTEAGLLSGATSRQPGASGGLLVELGAFGIIVYRDFSALLAEVSTVRSGLLAALRDIHDGCWSRTLGSGGGRVLAWAGKAGMLGAVTEAIDLHVATIGALGERFTYCRMPELDDEGRLAQGRAAMANVGRQEAMRAELARATSKFLAELVLPDEPVYLTDQGIETLTLLADLATRCRSSVTRETRDREVELVPQAEALARMQASLLQLARGMWACGVPDAEVGRLLAKVAMDSLPKGRRSVVELVANAGPDTWWTTAQAVDKLGLPSGITGRTLADLAAHGVVERDASRWHASAWLTDRWERLGLRTEPGTEPADDYPEAF